MIEKLRKITVNVNRKVETDEKLKEIVKAKDRTIVLTFTDEKTYLITIKDGKVLDPVEGSVDEPTLKVTTDVQTMEKLMSRKLNPIMAYAMKKIRVDGPIDEVMLLKDFF